MTDAAQFVGQEKSPSSPPKIFLKKFDVPETEYRTAIAIQHKGRMSQVDVAFVLRMHDAMSATYHGLCPRCLTGEISVVVKLLPDARFAEVPACPGLCLACEDQLDAILERNASTAHGDAPSNRAGLSNTLKMMTTRQSA